MWPLTFNTDCIWKLLYTLVQTGRKPTKRLCSLEDPFVRQYFREWSLLFFKNHVLYRKGIVSGHPVNQLVLPEVFRDIVFTGLHDDAGHQGRERTCSLLKSRFFWPGIDQFVDNRIRNCSQAGMKTYWLLLIISLALHNPYLRRTKPLVLKPSFFFEHFICHYGFPALLHSDQGRNFESAVITELCKIARCEKNVQSVRGSNPGHIAYRAIALPTELSGCLAHYLP